MEFVFHLGKCFLAFGACLIAIPAMFAGMALVGLLAVLIYGEFAPPQYRTIQVRVPV